MIWMGDREYHPNDWPAFDSTRPAKVREPSPGRVRLLGRYQGAARAGDHEVDLDVELDVEVRRESSPECVEALQRAMILATVRKLEVSCGLCPAEVLQGVLAHRHEASQLVSVCAL